MPTRVHLHPVRFASYDEGVKELPLRQVAAHPGAAAQLAPLVRPSTAVLFLQNGLGNEETLADSSERNTSSAASPICCRRSPSPASWRTRPDPVRSLPASSMAPPRGAPSSSSLSRIGGGRREPGRQREERHLGQIRLPLCPFGSDRGSAYAIVEIRLVPESRELFTNLLRDVAAVAAAEVAPLPAGPVVWHEAFAHFLEPGTFSSLPTTSPTASRSSWNRCMGCMGTRATQRAGVSVPTATAIYGVLRPWAVHNEQSSIYVERLRRLCLRCRSDRVVLCCIHRELR